MGLVFTGPEHPAKIREIVCLMRNPFLRDIVRLMPAPPPKGGWGRYAMHQYYCEANMRANLCTGNTSSIANGGCHEGAGAAALKERL